MQSAKQLCSKMKKLEYILKFFASHGPMQLLKKGKKAGLAAFTKEFQNNAADLADNRFVCEWSDRWPCLDDATDTTSFDAHYIYHPAWAARILEKTKPVNHVDISSSLHFVTIASAFVPILFCDYRPANITLPMLDCNKADLTALPFADNSIPSLSCMHVVEHIGLGRYGDPYDPQGDMKAMRELKRVLAPGGQLLFVVPVGGRARIQFNAHRIYTYAMIVAQFSELQLKSFALVTDAGEFIEHAATHIAAAQTYGCGCFWFSKKID